MPRFMLVTDTCSYTMKRSHPLVLKRLQAVAVDDVCMSVITKAELFYGDSAASSPAPEGRRSIFGGQDLAHQLQAVVNGLAF